MIDTSITNSNSMTNIPPRLAMFQSFAGYGKCSTTIALPVISAMGVTVCPVPTCVLSNHLGFSHVEKQDCTPHMQAYIDAWERNSASFDGLYCGFLNHTDQINVAENFLSYFKPEVFLLDPVMGDHGRLYSSVDGKIVESLKHLASYADILTPNLTESCLLTDTPYKENWTEEEFCELLLSLANLCPGKIAMTGIEQKGQYITYIYEDGAISTCITPTAGPSKHGTGDLFASILIADALHHRSFTESVKKASDFIALCISESEKMQIPEKEGLLFEPFLNTL